MWFVSNDGEQMGIVGWRYRFEHTRRSTFTEKMCQHKHRLDIHSGPCHQQTWRTRARAHRKCQVAKHKSVACLSSNRHFKIHIHTHRLLCIHYSFSHKTNTHTRAKTVSCVAHNENTTRCSSAQIRECYIADALWQCGFAIFTQFWMLLLVSNFPVNTMGIASCSNVDVCTYNKKREQDL